MPKLAFEAWLKEVDRILYVKVGLGYEDLPDWSWRDEYDEGASPAVAVREFRATGMGL